MAQGSSAPDNECDEAIAPGASRSQEEDGDSRVCRAMGAIWQDELGIECVVPADDYFALGGDSLTAVRIMMRVRAEFGVELPISVLLERPTLGEFAHYVSALGDAHQSVSPPSDGDCGIEEGLV